MDEDKVPNKPAHWIRKTQKADQIQAKSQKTRRKD